MSRPAAAEINSRFLRACRRLPVDATPVWFMRQAGRYMAEYRALRKRHTILEICKTPALAAEVTITAAEKLGVDAAIIFADLLLPLEPMGVKFHFAAGEGPVIEQPVRNPEQVRAMRGECAGELRYVAEAVREVAKHFRGNPPVLGFCGAPFTLASYIIEGGGSRQYLETKGFMHRQPQAWDALMRKLARVLTGYAAEQVRAGAEALQVFDSWVGCLSPADFRTFVLPHTSRMIAELKETGVPIIYFGTQTGGFLREMREAGADVIGLDWRVDLDDAWRELGVDCAVQGNLDPAVLLADWPTVQAQAQGILERAGGRAGHVFNLGHGIFPATPVENVKALVKWVHETTAKQGAWKEATAWR